MEMAVEEIADAGCLHVEPAFIKGYVDFDETAFSPSAAARLSNLAVARGVRIHAASAHLDLSEPDAAAALVRRLDFAADLGASFLITNSGPAGKRDAIRATVEAVIPKLEASGLTLALENPGHGSGNLTGIVSDAAIFLGEIGSPRVRLNHDTGNVFTYSSETRQPAEDLAAAPNLVAHVHLKDVKSTNEGWVFCALGDGDVDLANYWSAMPVGLPVTIELPLRLGRPRRADPQRYPRPLDPATIRRELTASLRYIGTLEAVPD
ncbi:sugar phosphate isomerase/epimerase family protein [Sinorhizobium meliloti]|uniref:sugar phosphate isomerase/epimerase family protein n=1 Tax=Rhizobium meliloti TaxID=382 RepID=UPI003F5CDA0E